MEIQRQLGGCFEIILTDFSSTSDTALLALAPTVTKVPDEILTEEDTIIYLVTLPPMKLVSPILNPTFMLLTAAYYFIKNTSADLKLTMKLQPLLTWIRGYLVDAAPDISILGQSTWKTSSLALEGIP